ncbi:MAG: hypothetical protein NC308_11630 [Clostridium sp.]|nr:hypothetical protein [Bacteroides sp.]MCM1199528.1 hypothetical protein [Clostridium sp.]
MKTIYQKLSLAALTFIICSYALKAQDIITMRDYSIVEAQVSEITDDTVTYMRKDLPDGPVFKASTCDIVSIKFANGTLQYFNAHGKIVSTHEEAIKPASNSGSTQSCNSPYLPQDHGAYSATVNYANKKLFFVDQQGRPLREIEAGDMADLQMYSKYSSNSIMATAGEWCWYFGLGWLVGSVLGVALAPEGSLTGGQMAAYILPGTLIPMAIGIPLDVIGTRNVKKIGEEYNRQGNVTLSFGGQRHGIGLAINF